MSPMRSFDPPERSSSSSSSVGRLPVLAANLVSWLQLAALPDSHQTRGWDIKRWRYRLFATAGKIITSARRHHLLLPGAAPEKPLIAALLESEQPDRRSPHQPTSRKKHQRDQWKSAPRPASQGRSPAPAFRFSRAQRPKPASAPRPLPEETRLYCARPPRRLLTLLLRAEPGRERVT